MSEENQLNEGLLGKVSGGNDIVNAHSTIEETEKERLEKEIKKLQLELESGNKSFEEAAKLMEQITSLMRQLMGLPDGPTPIIQAK